jgi:hypothetical protein
VSLHQPYFWEVFRDRVCMMNRLWAFACRWPIKLADFHDY